MQMVTGNLGSVRSARMEKAANGNCLSAMKSVSSLVLELQVYCHGNLVVECVVVAVAPARSCLNRDCEWATGCWLMSDSVSGTSRWYIPSLPRTTGIDFPPDIVHQSLEPMAAVDFWACGSPLRLPPHGQNLPVETLKPNHIPFVQGVESHNSISVPLLEDVCWFASL